MAKKMKGKKEESKKVEKQVPSIEEKPKRRHRVLKVMLSLVILIILVLGVFGVLRYIDEKQEESYIAGGKEAINKIMNEARVNGGVILKNGEEVIVLSKYYKEVEGTKTTSEPESVEETNSTKETNSTA